MRSKNFILLSLVTLVSDALAIIASYVLAFILRVKISDIPVYHSIPSEVYLQSLLLLLPCVIFIFSLLGLYRFKNNNTLRQTAGKLIIGAALAMVFMAFIDYFHPVTIFPAKLVLIYGFIISIILLFITRGVIGLALYLLHRFAWAAESVLIVGDGEIARLLVNDIKRPTSKYSLCGVVGDKRFKFVNFHSFKEAIEHIKPDIIIQVSDKTQPQIDPEILQFAERHYIDFKFIPSDVNNLSNQAVPELFMGDIPLISIEPTKLVGWGRFAKRAFDIVFSLLGILLLSPLFIFVYVAEKITDRKASAIFCQTRLTRGDKKFKLYKFRTQYAKFDGTTPEQAFTKIGQPELIKQYRDNGDFLYNDPRVTTLGRVLRRLSLDELPQLFNVLRGDISLVGPRALIPEELNSFDKKHLILNVKSGITGLAQISGRRDLPWQQRRELDVYYVQNWSFGLDLIILWRTVWQVFTSKGAV